MDRRRCGGFTLVEILVLITTTGMPVAMLILQRPRRFPPGGLLAWF